MHQDLWHSRASCSVRSCCVGSLGFCRLFRGFFVGLVSVFLVLLGLQGAPSLVFLCLLAQGCLQLVVADHWLHALLVELRLVFVSRTSATMKPSVSSKIFAIFWSAAVSRMNIPPSQGLKVVIAPVSAPLFKIGLVASVTSRLTRISVPSPAVNLTLLRVPLGLHKFTKHTQQRQLLLRFHHLNSGCKTPRGGRNNSTGTTRRPTMTGQHCLRVSWKVDLKLKMAIMHMSSPVCSPTQPSRCLSTPIGSRNRRFSSGRLFS